MPIAHQIHLLTILAFMILTGCFNLNRLQTKYWEVIIPLDWKMGIRNGDKMFSNKNGSAFYICEIVKNSGVIAKEDILAATMLREEYYAQLEKEWICVEFNRYEGYRYSIKDDDYHKITWLLICHNVILCIKYFPSPSLDDDSILKDMGQIEEMLGTCKIFPDE